MAKFVLSAFADEAGTSIDEQIAALKANGIDHIEPRNVDGKSVTYMTDEEVMEIKKKLDENGIKVNSLGSPIGKFKIEEDFVPQLEKTVRALEVAKLLDTKLIRMFSFFVEQDELPKYRDEVMKRLSKMADEAEKYGITLCHENESRIYGQMPGEVNDILSTVKKLGGIFDPANYRMNDADSLSGLNATLQSFKYMHVKDAIFSEQMIVPAGEGEGELAKAIDIINAHTDDVVYLTLEPHLHIFDAYKDIDDHELRGKYTFNTLREAFDFAADSLKKLLTKNGYRKDENNQWIK